MTGEDFLLRHSCIYAFYCVCFGAFILLGDGAHYLFPPLWGMRGGNSDFSVLAVFWITKILRVGY
jgi:hypothetical protein